MANTQHKSIPNADLHEPKGVSSAPLGTVYIADGVGSGVWQSPLTLATEQASTSGTAINFTSLPSALRLITVHFVGVSTNGTSGFLVQIGDSGGIETAGYNSVIGIGQAGFGWVMATSTAGFRVGDTNPQAAATYHGCVTLVLERASTNMWTISGNIGNLDGAAATIGVSAGSKSLSATLDRVRITTVNGTDTFDAGVVNISYC